MLLLVVTAHIFLFALILFRYKRKNFVQSSVSLPCITHLKTDDFSKSELFYVESLSNCDMPENVMLEILLRLPVKSLFRFKCVCKHWCSLIGSPSFINQHYLHESNQERLLLRHYKPNEDRYAFALYVDETFSEFEEPDHLQMPDTVDEIIGPVNGVFCVVGKSGSMALLNPAMRQFRPLPLPQFRPFLFPHLDVEPCVNGRIVGFGLDPLSGAYKLVLYQFFWDTEMDSGVSPPLVSIYNSGSDTWRQVEDVDLVRSILCVFWSQGNAFLNGVYYLLIRSDHVDVALYGGDVATDGTGIAALAFDVRSEKFQMIQLPDSVKAEGYCQLAPYGDSMALVSYDSLEMIDKYVNVWILEKEGCWTKHLTLGPFRDVLWPLGFWKKNELLLEGAASVLALDVSNQKLRTIETPGRENPMRKSCFFSYKETFVSIKGESGNCKLWDTSSDFVKNFFK